MELEEVIAQRRSIREFETKPVEKVKLEKLIEAARLCQSAKNRQPWQFMILEDGRKDQVAEIMLQLFESHDEELPGFVNSSRHTAQIMKNAPVLMLSSESRTSCGLPVICYPSAPRSNMFAWKLSTSA